MGALGEGQVGEWVIMSFRTGEGKEKGSEE